MSWIIRGIWWSILTCPLAYVGVCPRTCLQTIGLPPRNTPTFLWGNHSVYSSIAGAFHLFPLFRHDRASSRPTLRAAQGLHVFPYLLLRIVGAAGVSSGRGRLLSRTAKERPQIIRTAHEEGGLWRTAPKQWIAMTTFASGLSPAERSSCRVIP